MILANICSAIDNESNHTPVEQRALIFL